MSKDNNFNANDMRVMSGVMIMLAGLILPIAIGVLFGAGWGWLTLVGVFLIFAVRFAAVSKEAREKEQMDGQSKFRS